ncbi:MAG: ABC transporter substrate-binding protein [Butyrivibrio sp.]|nr:ABC transporter substrate-binding protein [Butyrivibrio sp.]
MKANIMKVIIVIVIMFAIVGCGKEKLNQGRDSEEEVSVNDETVTLNIAYQYGLAYAPVVIAQEQGLIEQAYEEMTGKQVVVVWNQMSSGADINTGISSGSIDVGFMGVAPAITGVTKGVGYKIFSNISGQEHGLMTNDENIHTLGDLIGSDKQIALVNIGSIQHILLGMALENAGYDPHGLDANIVAMKHPDGMVALETGNVSCHLTSNPYIFKEREEENLYEIEGVSEAWGINDSFIVGVASESLYDNNPELYQALCDAIEEAIVYMNDNPEEAAKITCEYNGNSEEDELAYIKKSKYMVETSGVFELASFMARNGFIDEMPETYEELVFENVSGD